MSGFEVYDLPYFDNFAQNDATMSLWLLFFTHLDFQHFAQKLKITH